MKRSTLGRVGLPAAIVLTLGLSACASNESGGSGSGSSSGASSSASPSVTLSGSLSGAGSTAQQAAQQAWIAGITQSDPGLQVNYDGVGSGAGVTQFTSGAVAFAGSDAYLATAQIAPANARCAGGAALDVPDYISPIALAYNIKGVSKLQLSPSTAAKIFAQKIKTWNDPAIAADNPGATLPSTPITVVNRSDKSGTTQNFTDWLNKTAPSDWTQPADQVWPVPGGEAAQGTSGVISAVKAADGSIGYADASQLGDLKAASVKVGSAFVAPSASAAAKAVDASSPATGRPAGDLAIDVNRTTTASGAYPVVLVSYAIFCTKYSDTATAQNVKGYLSYITSPAGQQAAAKAAGSAPLSSDLSTKVKASLAKITTGS